MVADNCRLSCQLDTLVLLTNRSAKLIRKCCKSGNYGYHFSLCGSLKDDTKPEKSSWQPPDFELRRMKFFRDNFQHFQKQFTHWLGDKQTIWALRFKPNFSEIDLTWLFLKIDFKAVFTDKSGFSNRQEINAKYLALNLKSKNNCFLLMFNRADLTVGGGKKLSGPTS